LLHLNGCGDSVEIGSDVRDGPRREERYESIQGNQELSHHGSNLVLKEGWPHFGAVPGFISKHSARLLAREYYLVWIPGPRVRRVEDFETQRQVAMLKGC